MRNGSVDYVQVPALMCTLTGYEEQTISKNRRNDITIANIAHLVEHRPSKSGVAGSSPVIRSNGFQSGTHSGGFSVFAHSGLW